MSKEFLRQLPLFAGLPEDDLERLYNMAETVQVPAGTLLIEEGAMGDSLYIVLSGEFEVTKHSAQEEVVLATLGVGEVVGEMALLEQTPRSASVRALQESSVLKVSQWSFQELVCTSPATMLAILRTVTSRLRSTEAMLRQSEKMAELGKLAAGLAHELNNPAAAARRSTLQMTDSLTHWLSLASKIGAMQLDTTQTARINELRQGVSVRARQTAELDPITRSDRESDVQTFLEAGGTEQAWDIAPILVSFGWDTSSLKAATDVFSPEQLPAVLEWLGTGYTVYSLLSEVGTSAERISEIVKAVKEYSYLDRAPIQQVNVVDGLENTLLILKHKLKNGITVIRNYAKDLPRIEAYASELNQVWTNIIDNAVDAMQGTGELRLCTYSVDGQIAVEICDNGPGIPADIQPKIFESFFTTKPMGVGTGLGLHIAYNIIVHKHRGQIKVNSQPGKTCFQVLLPAKVERE
ncbi:MAG: cyclic nucleotide-binding domain-containing protein [Chloroflexi bacterium]|nr:cyclic nucleotide-binding domain-containing protein [Chloroflexota bacterium]